MRILLVVKSLVLAGGGAERVCIKIANYLHAGGHDVVVATFDFPSSCGTFYDLDEGIPVSRLGHVLVEKSFTHGDVLQAIVSTRRLAKSKRPDVVLAFMHSAYVPAAFAMIGTGIPLISSDHTTLSHFSERPLERVLARWAQRLSFAKTVVSQQIFDEHPYRWRSNLYVLPNPVDISAFATARAQSRSNTTIVCVGGLRPEKDQLTLIAAFDLVAQEFPDWRLRLVGDGSERPAIEARIAASPFRARIELPGVRRDVALEYRQASIVAMPSRYESLGMVAIEALASGRPVVGFGDCAGAVTLIQHGVNGLLAEPLPDRARGLAAALRTLMGNPQLRYELGARAPETVEHYSVDSIVSQWENLLMSAAASRDRSDSLGTQPIGRPSEPGPRRD
jgi:glycosyltransferase involved in cell wall biosynthesis